MKYLIVLFAVLFAAVKADFTVKTMEDLVKYRTQCVQELKVSADEVEQFKKWNFTETGKAPCYLKCVLTHMSLFDDAKGFNVENLVKQMCTESDKDTTKTESEKCAKHDIVKAEIEKCAKQESNDKCLNAYKGFNCFRQNNLQLIKVSLHSKDEKKDDKKDEKKEAKKTK